ncbi:MAG: UDP-2,4-diacetamido-2,4,6-trideoxy-beta-L-altropyranose hydrolase [Lachnospiraceae bacterium]|nr:UDP-2,4-diacetamido-2,4,6-trideoxy-beta-L-altropyranose hydrolase [Lachnospiraceae bacterium]
MGNICIRVDGNEIIATGHVMRCLSIAHQIKNNGEAVEFVVADNRPTSIIEENGFNCYVLGTTWDDMDTEIQKFSEYIKRNNIDTVLIDSYFVTENYLASISKQAKVCYIDDLDKFIYPVHTLINYGLQCDRDYERRYEAVGSNTKFLLGGKYAPLREEFSCVPYEVRENVEKVLITTGGTDQLNMAYKLAEKLVSENTFKNIEFHIIVGRFNGNKDNLKILGNARESIVLHEKVTNMSYWMRKCDVAISAAGTTTFELSACGIPSICFEVADNQVGARLWEQGGYMIYAGNAYMEQEKCIGACIKGLLKLQGDYNFRKNMSHKMQGLVDGLGASRIADYLIGLSKEN